MLVTRKHNIYNNRLDFLLLVFSLNIASLEYFRQPDFLPASRQVSGKFNFRVFVYVCYRFRSALIGQILTARTALSRGECWGVAFKFLRHRCKFSLLLPPPRPSPSSQRACSQTTVGRDADIITTMKSGAGNIKCHIQRALYV